MLAHKSVSALPESLEHWRKPGLTRARGFDVHCGAGSINGMPLGLETTSL